MVAQLEAERAELAAALLAAEARAVVEEAEAVNRAKQNAAITALRRSRQKQQRKWQQWPWAARGRRFRLGPGTVGAAVGPAGRRQHPRRCSSSSSDKASVWRAVGVGVTPVCQEGVGG